MENSDSAPTGELSLRSFWSGFTRHHASILLIFMVVWLWAAINPVLRFDWLLENVLVFAFIPALFISGHYFRFSKLSYVLILVFMLLHLVGAHYSYDKVPFGYTLGQWFDTTRNMYDRLVHFCFGLLFFFPIREVYLRTTGNTGFWAYFVPISVILGASALYEISEYFVAVHISANPLVISSFLGSQGDIWDTQRDMMMAGFGALVGLALTLVVNRSRP